jgi:hypothetical protein
MQLYSGKSLDVVLSPAEADGRRVAELGPGFSAMPEILSISMIEQTILSWTPGRALGALWLLAQRGVRAAWAPAGSEARS